jgi:glucose dehydrogenase
MKQTIAQQIKWDFKTNGSLEIKNKNGKVIYYENLYNNWAKWEYDSKGNQIYVENSAGVWAKWEYDSKGNQIYFENSRGDIIDNRPKPCEDKIVEIDGEKFKLVKV